MTWMDVDELKMSLPHTFIERNYYIPPNIVNNFPSKRWFYGYVPNQLLWIPVLEIPTILFDIFTVVFGNIVGKCETCIQFLIEMCLWQLKLHLADLMSHSSVSAMMFLHTLKTSSTLQKLWLHVYTTRGFWLQTVRSGVVLSTVYAHCRAVYATVELCICTVDIWDSWSLE